jgi:uncharacterized OB-fold protein
MPRGLIAAAAYLPRHTDGVRRLGAPDEDAFTLAATALERAQDGRPTDGREVVVRTAGELRGVEAPALSAVLGAPVRLDARRAGATLEEMLGSAQAGAGPQWVVVAFVGDGRAGGELPPPGSGAVALLFDDGPRAFPLAEGGLAGPARGPLTSLAPLFTLVAQSGDPRWIGDWRADPAQGLRRAEAAARPGDAGATVSQGAYVPSPRDDESRASRWRFETARCGACGARTFPARGRCRACGATEGLVGERLPRNGWTVVASTWIGPGGQPTEFDAQVEASGSYGVVLAELAPDVRATLQVADGNPQHVGVGSRVDTRLRRLYPMEGAWRYGRKAVPVAEERGR